MDWNKTKTIFIIVFSILNVFLYSMYVNSYNEAKKLETLGQINVDDELKASHITIDQLPTDVKKISYISGKTRPFEEADLASYKENQKFVMSTSGLILRSALITPYPVKEFNEQSLSAFVASYVPLGEEYKLFSIDNEKRIAIFFQTIQNHTIFYNESAYIKVTWNEDNAITGYEQTAFQNLKTFGEKNTLIGANQAVKTLFEKGYLPEYAHVKSAELGYSTLVPLTETRVLSPTWRIHVELKEKDDTIREADFFVNANAVDGQVIDMQENKESIESN